MNTAGHQLALGGPGPAGAAPTARSIDTDGASAGIPAPTGNLPGI
jgi:hypothetical protein